MDRVKFKSTRTVPPERKKFIFKIYILYRLNHRYYCNRKLMVLNESFSKFNNDAFFLVNARLSPSLAA